MNGYETAVNIQDFATQLLKLPKRQLRIPIMNDITNILKISMLSNVCGTRGIILLIFLIVLG